MTSKALLSEISQSPEDKYSLTPSYAVPRWVEFLTTESGVVSGAWRRGTHSQCLMETQFQFHGTEEFHRWVW